MYKFNKETNQVGDKDHNLWEIKSVKLYKKTNLISEKKNKNLWYFIFPIISKKMW